MNKDTKELMLALIRNVVFAKELTESERSLYRKELLPELYHFSQKHDMTHLVAFGLEKNKLIDGSDEWKQKFSKEMMKAVYRSAQMQGELERLTAALEGAGIDFMPLKGSVLRTLYPEPWMRTSCDIDILVHATDAEKATEYLVNKHGYTLMDKGSHDISLFSPSKVHLELHYDLEGNEHIKGASLILNSVWEKAVLRYGFEYCYDMPDELFYFYHIEHMAKHFENGGCGIRPFVDILILKSIKGADESKRDDLLKQGELFLFAETAHFLSKVWFGAAEHTELTLQMENYILHGGAYGTNKNRIAVQQQKKGGSLKYALSKIFISYDEIKFHYPILQKYRFLTPVMEVRRWCKLIFCGHARRAVKELQYNGNITQGEARRTQAFLKNIGL